MPLVVNFPEGPEPLEDVPRGGRPWRWILGFFFAGVMVLLLSGLLGLLRGKG